MEKKLFILKRYYFLQKFLLNILILSLNFTNYMYVLNKYFSHIIT